MCVEHMKSSSPGWKLCMCLYVAQFERVLGSEAYRPTIPKSAPQSPLGWKSLGTCTHGWPLKSQTMNWKQEQGHPCLRYSRSKHRALFFRTMAFVSLNATEFEGRGRGGYNGKNLRIWHVWRAFGTSLINCKPFAPHFHWNFNDVLKFWKVFTP